MTKNDLMTKIENLGNALEASRETSDRLAMQCRDKDAELAACAGEIGRLTSSLSACQRDLADRDAEIATINRDRDTQAETITKYQERTGRIEQTNAEIRALNEQQARIIIGLRSDLEKSGTAHASDHIELVALREECERLRVLLAEMTTDRNAQVEARDDFERVANEWMGKCERERCAHNRTLGDLNVARDQLVTTERQLTASRSECDKQIELISRARTERDEQGLARQRVQIELDKANAKITELSGPAELRLDLKVAREQLKVAEHQIGQLQTHAEQLTRDRDRALELAGDLRREQRTMTTADYGMTDGIHVMGAAVCHCDDLQEQLANLHRVGKEIMIDLPMGGRAIRFIETMTRAGDCLEEIANDESI